MKCINKGNFLKKYRTFKLFIFWYNEYWKFFLLRRTALTFSRQVINNRVWKVNADENENLEKLKSVSLGIKRIALPLNFPPENRPQVNCLLIYYRTINTLRFRFWKNFERYGRNLKNYLKNNLHIIKQISWIMESKR